MNKLKYLAVLLLVVFIVACSSSEKTGKDPFCEFVDGNYTFDIDLRRTISFQGIDFEYKYLDNRLREVLLLEANYVHLKAIGYYYDERKFGINNTEIQYSSIFPLPETNKIQFSYLNILTSLQAERVIYLVNSAYSYKEACIKSAKEIRDQLKSSDYFSSYQLETNVDFKDISVENELLNVYVRAISYMINKRSQVLDDKSICQSLWDDYIINYSLTGSLDLASLSPHTDEARAFLNGMKGQSSLWATVSNYSVPFIGGMPLIRGNSIYYGLDTLSCTNKFKTSKKSAISVHSPKYSKLICNGYLQINADIMVDSTNYAKPPILKVTNLSEQKIDSIYEFDKLLYSKRFSQILWFKKNSTYKIDLIYGEDKISYELVNKMNFLSSIK